MKQRPQIESLLRSRSKHVKRELCREPQMHGESWKQVEALFEGAQQRPADQRAEFLRQACPGDPELCAEVESLLRVGAKLDNFPIVALIFPAGLNF
jgi:hypothetical protein